jgi:hypothetical protein
LVKTAAGPPEMCELSSLMTAAMKPQAMPVAIPRQAARRDGEPPRAEVQGGDLEGEAGDHATEADQPGRLPGQPEYEPRVEAAHLAAPLKVPGAEPLANRGSSGTDARGK